MVLCDSTETIYLFCEHWSVFTQKIHAPLCNPVQQKAVLLPLTSSIDAELGSADLISAKTGMLKRNLKLNDDIIFDFQSCHNFLTE